jgi:hypothetical protein
MRRSILTLALSLLMPAAAMADPGSYDREFYRNLERNYQVMRDGSIHHMMQEGQANADAHARVRPAERVDAYARLRGLPPDRRTVTAPRPRQP